MTSEDQLAIATRSARFWRTIGLSLVAVLLMVACVEVIVLCGPRMLSGSYVVYVVFEEAPGVQRGTPVRKSGIPIGRVTNIEFARDRAGRQDTRILVTAAIEGDKQIYEDETCCLRANMAGDTTLEFVREPQRAKSIAPISPDATVEGVYIPDPVQIIGKMQAGLGESIESFTRTNNELRETSRTRNPRTPAIMAIKSADTMPKSDATRAR